MNPIVLGVAGGSLAKGAHIFIQELSGQRGVPEAARRFREAQPGFSLSERVFHIAEFVLLIPLCEEGLFRAFPAYLTTNPLVNFAFMPTLFGAMHYNEKQGELNPPLIASQVWSGFVFAVLLRAGGFPAAFTAHAISNLFSVLCLMN